MPVEQPKEPAPELIPEPSECQVGETRSCNTPKPGPCKAGVISCVGGKWGPCVPKIQAKAEACNGLDDDCNGTIDDGLSTCPKYIPFLSQHAVIPGTEILQDAKGNIYVTGIFSKSMTVGSRQYMASGALDVFVARIEPGGDVAWVKVLGFKPISGGRDEDFIAGAIHGDALYLAGTSYGEATFPIKGGQPAQFRPKGLNDAFVLKLDLASGEILWFRSFGSTGHDAANAIIADAAGDIYILGNFSNSAVFGKTACTTRGAVDLFLYKMSPKGEGLWAQCWGGKGWDAQDFGAGARGLAFSPRGTLYAAAYVGVYADKATDLHFGTKLLSVANQTGVLVEVETSKGEVQSAHLIGTAAPGEPQTTSMANELRVDPRGRISVLGKFTGTRSFFGKTLTSSFQGKVLSHYIAHLSIDKDGVLSRHWTKAFSEHPGNLMLDIRLTPKTHDILVGGFFRDTLTLDSTILTTPSQGDLLLLQLSHKDGSVQKVVQGKSTGLDSIQALLLNDAQTLFLFTVIRSPKAEFFGLPITRSGAAGADGGLWIIPQFK